MWENNEKLSKFSLRFRIIITILSVVFAFKFSFDVWADIKSISEVDKIELPVIMYHLIIDDPSKVNDYTITPAMLKADLEYIKSQGYNTVVMQDLINYVKSSVPLPEKPILLTFDDGYFNNYLHAYPMLEQYDMCAVISIIGIETEKYSDYPEPHELYSHCTWENLKEMQDSGVFEIQSHSYDMHHMSNGYLGIDRKNGEELVAYRSRLFLDLSKLQSLFKEKMGYSPTTFAYPFGSAHSESQVTIDDLGFEATLGTENKMYYISKDEDCLFYIPRFNRTSDNSAKNILEFS